MLILVAMGILVACCLGILVYAANVLIGPRKLNKPLTAVETLKAAPPFSVSTLRSPRLTTRGKVFVLMTVAFGLVAMLVSLALIWQIAHTGLTKETLPALVTVLPLDAVPIGFGVSLHRTRRLVLSGRFATGIVVAANVGGIKSWGLFYDFLDGGGQVVRGSSLRSFYTVALARAFHGAMLGDYFGVGCYVPILYRDEKPTQNTLYVSYAWEV
jgi:hypothetical protein